MVTVRYFAHLKEVVGVESEEIEWDGGDLDALLDLLDGRGRGFSAFRASRPILCAVNQEYSEGGAPVRDGDEVALFPPVSGG